MKPNALLRALLLGSSTLLAVSATHAATLYWDGNDITGNADGGAGIWDASTGNWNDAPIAGAAATWNNATPDFAVFPGAADSVMLGADITVAGLRFDTNGYVIDAASHSLSFGAGNPSILLSGNANATITGTIGGSGNVAIGPLPAVGRILTLNGTSAGGWSGATTVHLGSTLALAQSNQALLNTSAIILNGGGITLTNTNTTEAALNRVSDTAPVTAHGGTVTLANTLGEALYAETLGPVALTTGQTNFALATNQTGGGGQAFTLSGLSRTGAANTSAVTFSAAVTSPNADSNRIVVTGAAATPTGQIVGPWATTGTAAGTQTDYAVFDSSAQVLPASIAASEESTWTDPATAYTSSVAVVALSGNRAMTALRNTGTTATLTLSNGVAGYNLATNGILNAVNSLFTIAPGSVPGAITVPGTSGGQLHINTGGSRSFPLALNNNTIANNLAIDISAPINDNGGPVTLVKSGDTSVLRLNSAAGSNYSGGTVINAGILLVNGDAALGAASGKITLNGGQLRSSVNGVTFNREVEVGPAGGAYAGIGNQTNINFAGKLTGSGVLNLVDSSGAGGRVAFFNSTENEFTGAFTIASNSMTVRVNSLPDVAGAGDIIFYKGGTGNASAFEWGAGATAPLVLNHRAIQIINNTGVTFPSAGITNSNTTHAFTINTDLIAIGSTVKSLQLSAVAGPINAFNGKISDATGGGVVNLFKAGVGTWTVTGANTYTGTTRVGQGTLRVNSIKNFGVASPLGAPLAANIQLGDANNSGVLSYTGPGDSTDRTIQVGNATAGNTGGGTIENSGTGPLIFTGANFNSAIAGITATRTLTLGGSPSGGANEIQGIIQDNVASTGRINVAKANDFSTWILSGANSYTGSTTINGGTLRVDSPGSLAAASAVTVNGTGTLGGDGTIGGNVTVTASANLAPGAPLGTLTLLGDLTISAMGGGSGVLAFDLGPIAASDKITVAGTLTIGDGALGFSNFDFTNAGGLQPGTYKLITSGAAVAGTLAAADLTGTVSGFECLLKINGNDLELEVAALGGDYGDWAGQFAPADLGDPNADFDGDGLTNNQERIFGLNPTSGSSSNPISVPLNSSTGTFSFTRRDPLLTGLIFNVWTSTDLETWQVDTTAVITPGAVVDQVQTVAVALSAGLLTEPRLFVKVTAEEPLPPPPLLFADFESDNGGFEVVTTSGTAWAHGTPNSPTKGGGAVTSGAGGSANCWGTNLTGVYAASTNTSLRTPPIDLTNVTGATLSFAKSVDTADGHTLEVNILNEAGNTVIANLIPAAQDQDTSTSPWETVAPVALPAAAFGQSVRIEWRFIGDGDGNYNGVYIDNVSLIQTAP